MPETSESPEFVKPYVTQTLGSKSLHFSLSAVQSSMNLMQPDALVLEYTQTMMGFMLFNPRPDNIAMIGLGGGSLAKFCYRYLPKTSIVVVEINPHVIALRDEFLVPPDDQRFRVLEGDGALFVRRPPKSFDVLMVDGYEVSGVPARLCSRRFYDHCYEALHPGGLLVANFHSLHPQFDVCVARMREAFKGAVLVVDDPGSGNGVVFACKGHQLQAPPKGRLKCPPHLPEAAWRQLDQAFDVIAQVARRA